LKSFPFLPNRARMYPGITVLHATLHDRGDPSGLR
jgi:hypothetical protein